MTKPNKKSTIVCDIYHKRTNKTAIVNGLKTNGFQIWEQTYNLFIILVMVSNCSSFKKLEPLLNYNVNQALSKPTRISTSTIDKILNFITDNSNFTTEDKKSVTSALKHYKRSKKKIIDLGNLTENDFEDLFTPDLKNFFFRYKNDTDRSPVLGTNISDKFFDYLEKFPSLYAEKFSMFSTVKQNKLIEKITNLRKICFKINGEQMINKFIAYRKRTSSASIRQISNNTAEMGLNVSMSAIDRVKIDNIFNKSNLMNHEFFEEDWLNLAELKKLWFQELIQEHHNQTDNHMNHGQLIKPDFFKWIDRKKKYSSEEKLQNLHELKQICNHINDSQEIPKFVIDKILHTPLSQEKIYQEGKKFGLNVSGQTIGRIARKYIYPDDNHGYLLRFGVIGKIPSEKKKQIINYIKSTKMSSVQIASFCNVAQSSVIRISQDYDIDNHGERFPQDISKYIGRVAHRKIHKVITANMEEYFRDFLYISEALIYKGRKFKIDALIPNNRNFLIRRLFSDNNSDLLKIIFKNIDLELIKKLYLIKASIYDFSSSVSPRNNIKKCEKYQDPEMMFFIVGLVWYSLDETINIPNSDKVKYPDNIKIISHDLFADLVGLRGIYREIYERIIDLVYNQDLESLEKLQVPKIKLKSTPELVEYLKNEGLIKNKLDDYFKYLYREGEVPEHSSIQTIITRFTENLCQDELGEFF